jgi:hypothetical protein
MRLAVTTALLAALGEGLTGRDAPVGLLPPPIWARCECEGWHFVCEPRDLGGSDASATVRRRPVHACIAHDDVITASHRRKRRDEADQGADSRIACHESRIRRYGLKRA